MHLIKLIFFIEGDSRFLETGTKYLNYNIDAYDCLGVTTLPHQGLSLDAPVWSNLCPELLKREGGTNLIYLLRQAMSLGFSGSVHWLSKIHFSPKAPGTAPAVTFCVQAISWSHGLFRVIKVCGISFIVFHRERFPSAILFFASSSLR